MIPASRQIEQSFLIVCFALFFLLGLYHLTYFGLEYDECLFINAALGDLDNFTFVALKWNDIPILCYLYIGALKSWLYALIFKLFGVSVYSIRLPVLLMAGVNLGLVFRLVKNTWGSTMAMATLFLVATDLTFLNLQRFDKGPTTLEMFFKLMIVFVALNDKLSWQRKGFWVFFLMILGVYNKFNFIWFANAFYGTYFITHLPAAVRNLKANGMRQFLKSPFFVYGLGYAVFLGLFFGVTYLLGIKVGGGNHDAAFFLGRLRFGLSEIEQTIYQNNILNVYGWSYHSRLATAAVKLLLGLFVVLNGWLYLARKIAFKSRHTQLLVLVMLLFCQYVVTPEAMHVWHIYILFPFLTVLMLHTFYVFLQNTGPVQWMIAPVMLWLAVNFIAYKSFYTYINEKKCLTEIFLPEIKAVENLLRATPPTTVMSIDWGTHTQLQALLHRQHRFIEPYRELRYADLRETWWETEKSIFSGKEPAVILYPYSVDIKQKSNYGYVAAMPPENAESILAFLRTKGVTIGQPEIILNRCDDKLYFVYKAKI